MVLWCRGWTHFVAWAESLQNVCATVEANTRHQIGSCCFASIIHSGWSFLHDMHHLIGFSFLCHSIAGKFNWLIFNWLCLDSCRGSVRCRNGKERLGLAATKSIFASPSAFSDSEKGIRQANFYGTWIVVRWGIPCPLNSSFIPTMANSQLDLSTFWGKFLIFQLVRTETGPALLSICFQFIEQHVHYAIPNLHRILD